MIARAGQAALGLLARDVGCDGSSAPGIAPTSEQHRARWPAGYQAARAASAARLRPPPATGGAARGGAYARSHPGVSPPGFGKTVLLADWVTPGKRAVAWLSLDVGDNDPARFW